jgi:predicted HNH restriction endonuclease
MKRSIRKKLNASGNCKCEVCDKDNVLVEHHIRGRDIPNANTPSNLANVCSNCHRLIHTGNIIIENRLRTTNGFLLLWHYKKDPSFTGNDAKVYTY